MSNDTFHHVAMTHGIKLMNNILKKSPYSLKDRAVRRQSDAVETDIIPLPNSISEHYTKLTCRPLFGTTFQTRSPSMNGHK